MARRLRDEEVVRRVRDRGNASGIAQSIDGVEKLEIGVGSCRAEETKETERCGREQEQSVG
jgi:hypothetical protein